MDFEITPLVPSETRKRRSKYPFDKLKQGEMFIVGADECVKSVRTLAARYNQVNGTDISCKLLADGSLQVMREYGKNVTDTSPSKAEFCFWVASFKQGECSQMASMYKPRFGQLQDWLNELQDNSTMRFDVKITEDVLSITRLPDYVEPVITPIS